MRQFLSTACLAGALLFGRPVVAQSIAPPQVGTIQDSKHSLRPVLGLAANFVLGDSLGEGVVSSASSGSFSMVKTDAALVVLNRDGQVLCSMDADAGSAAFAFSTGGVPAFVYVPQSQVLLRWVSDHLERTPFNADQIGGVVLAIASPGPDRLTFLVRHDDGIWSVDLSGSAKWLLPAVDGPVLLRGDGSLLYATADGIQLRQADGSEVNIVGAGVRPTTLEHMGSDWVHVTEQNSSRHYAIRLASGHEQIYQLPEAEQ
jgi:hypothetical protein